MLYYMLNYSGYIYIYIVFIYLFIYFILYLYLYHLLHNMFLYYFYLNYR